MRSPLEWYATAVTFLVWPERLEVTLPEARLKTRTILSTPPVTVWKYKAQKCAHEG